MSVAWIVLTGVVAALLLVSTVTLARRHHQHHGPAGEDALHHLEKLRAQRPHVERLADRLEHEQSSNHFRLRVERALRGQQ
jgi:hypothetical protein